MVLFRQNWYMFCQDNVHQWEGNETCMECINTTSVAKFLEISTNSMASSTKQIVYETINSQNICQIS